MTGAPTAGRAPGATPAAPRTVRLAYTAIGLLIGAAWLVGRDVPPVEHALRLLVVVVVVPALMRLLRRFRAVAVSHPPMRLLIVAKVLLVAAALGLDVLLARWTDWAAALTALALALAVALGGPVLHTRFPPPDGTASSTG